MLDYLRVFYRRVYNAVYFFFDKLSMRTKPQYDEFTDDEIENIFFEENTRLP